MRIVYILALGVILTGYVSSTRDCGECPSGCSYGTVFSKKKDVCTCSCAPNPCLRKKCTPNQICRPEDREICRAGNCITFKVAACVGEESPTNKETIPIYDVPRRPDTLYQSGYIQGQLKIVPESLNIYEGDRAEIRCDLFDATHNANRPFNGAWAREGGKSLQPLPSNFRVLANNVLLIENARESDSGKYRCTAVAKYETVFENLQIRVMPRPRQAVASDFPVYIRVLEPSMSSHLIQLGSRVFVECSARDPNVRHVSWSKISGGYDRSMKSAMGVNAAAFDLASLSSDDFGTYVCTVMRQDGHMGQNSIDLRQDKSWTSYASYLIEKNQRDSESPRVAYEPPQQPQQQQPQQQQPQQQQPQPPQPQKQQQPQQPRQPEPRYIPQSVPSRYQPGVETYDGNNQPFVFTKELPDYPDASVVPQVELIGPKEIKVNEDASIVVEFRVTNGGGNIRIGKYNDVLPAGSRVEVHGDIYKLYLNNLRRDDKGYYTCTVTSKYGASDRKAIMIHVGKCKPDKSRIRVTPPPQVVYVSTDHSRNSVPQASIVKSHDIIYANEGDSISIECLIAGATSYHFNKLEDQLSLNNLARKSGDKFILELSNLKARDSGTYECMADNTAGTSTDTVKLQVQAKMELDAPQLPKASIIKSQDVRELKAGESTVIECEVERSSDVKWSRESDGMPKTTKNTLMNNIHKLTIYDLEVSDSGYYFCTAFNEFGNDRCWIYLDIKPASDSAPAPAPEPERAPASNPDRQEVSGQQQEKIQEKIQDGLMVRINGTLPRENQDVLELTYAAGQSVTIDCTVSNGQISDFRKAEGKSGNINHERFSDHERLIISDLTETDAGYYVCEAINDSKNIRDLVFLNVIKP